MIMLLTQDSDLREELRDALQRSGHTVERAYELYERGERHEGDDLRHWFQAERDLVMQ